MFLPSLFLCMLMENLSDFLESKYEFGMKFKLIFLEVGSTT